MPIVATREALGRVFHQRCFLLFGALLVFMCVVGFVEPTPLARFFIAVALSLVAVASVAAVGRTTFSFLVTTLVALPAVAMRFLAYATDLASAQVKAYFLYAILFSVTIIYLLRYIFQPRIMTADKLYGAAATYLLLGVAWTFVYASVQHFQPHSFLAGGQPATLGLADFYYFSFTTLTGTSYGDIAPALRLARGLTVVEQVTGTLYIAILIARLAGLYPRRGDGPGS